MDTKYGWKNFKVQIQKLMDVNQKIQNKFKVQTDWYISNFFESFLNNTRFYGKILYTSGIWERNHLISITNAMYNYKNVQLKFKQILDASSIFQYDGHMTFDIWKHLTSCGSMVWFEVSMKE